MEYARDRFSEILHQKERADENIFFARRDRELIRRLRMEKQAARQQRLRELALRRCPECGTRLASGTDHDDAIQLCPAGHGRWIRPVEASAKPQEREQGIGRYFYRPSPLWRH